jgi:hypothetical protein
MTDINIPLSGVEEKLKEIMGQSEDLTPVLKMDLTKFRFDNNSFKII